MTTLLRYRSHVPFGGGIMQTTVKRAIKDQKGAALTLVLVLLVLGGLILAPLLGLMSAGLMAGQVYENSMRVLYASDAGVEDGLWQIGNVELADLFYDYDEYNYYTQWGYDLNNHQGGVAEVVLVNNNSVYVTIENEWIPMDLPAPDAETARQIIEEGELIIAGNPSLAGTSKYEIKMSYDPCGGAANAQVVTLGIWLPPDFGYVMGSSDLEKAVGQPYYSVPDLFLHKGGYAVVWDFATSVLVKDFPDTVIFQYSGEERRIPGAAMAWIVTSGGYYWDADVRIYQITSTATDPDTGKQTTVESYTSKIEPRKLGSALSGDYHATGATLMTATGSDKKYRNRLFNESSATIAQGDIPSDALIEAAYLYWSGWIETAPDDVTVFYENCNDFSAPVMAWTAGSAWRIYSSYYDSEFRGNAYVEVPPGQWQQIWGTETCDNFVYPIMDWAAGNAWDINNGRFRGTAYNKGSSPGRYVTMSSSINLSAYAGQTVRVSWQQAEDGYLEDSDRLYFAFSADGGSTWSANYEAFRDDSPPSSFTYNIPNTYLTNDFRMRFYLYGFSERDYSMYTEYCYIDNIGISVFVVPPYDPPGRYLTMSASIALGAYAGQTVEVSCQQAEGGSLEDSDRLYYAFSANGGSTWSADYEAFRDDNPPSSFTYTIPDMYLTNNFRMRFYLYGFEEGGSSSEYCYIDDITITAQPPLVETAKVNRVKFNGTQITSTKWQVAPTPDSGAPESWSYSCYYDATGIVRAELGPDMSGTFTLGHVLEGSGYNLYPSGTTAYPLATPAKDQSSTQYQWTYAGWSLLIIYSSPETKGHQLYLFDTFHYVGAGGSPAEVPFSISGFLAPDDTTGSHLTYFVGEGDDHYTGDSIEINDNPLSEPPNNPWDNIFNSYSNSMNDPVAKSGIDIDTFDISQYVDPNDSSAEVILITLEGSQGVAEIYNLVYIILSFRSSVTSGGVMGYLIRG